MRVLKGIGLGLAYNCRNVGCYMRVMKGIGLGLTCTRRMLYEGNESDRVRVNMLP